MLGYGKGMGVTKPETLQELERKRAEGFKLIKEYENYYLYGKYNEKGKLLYRECFSKFDIDGVTKSDKSRNRYWKW